MKKRKMIITGAPQVTRAEVDAVKNVARSGRWVSGPAVTEFTEQFKNFCGAKYVIPVSSGTAALHLALDVLGIGPGDEVITTPFTYPATVDVIEYVKAKPVFVDIESDSFNMEPGQLEKAISKNTKAIIPIDIAGLPCNYDRIMEIAKKYEIPVIDDACHAIEAEYHHKKIGTITDMTCFSLDVTKNVAGGMGGIITTNNETLAKTVKLRSHFGIPTVPYYEPYDTVYPGYKYDMTDFCAALASEQLNRVKDNLQKRNMLWDLYQTNLGNIRAIQLPINGESVVHSRHLFMILLNFDYLRCSRAQFMQELESYGVMTRIRFTPIHLQTYYKNKYSFRKNSYPVSESIGDRVVCLPISPVYNKSDILFVIKSIHAILKKFSK